MSDTTSSALHLEPIDNASSAATFEEAIWANAFTLDAFIDQAVKLQDLWRSTRRLARVDNEAVNDARALHGPLRLLVLLEDWCGDAIHTIPFVMRLVEANPQLELRVIKRDEHDALMQQHLSGSSRSIPVLIAYNANGRECGWWGPRPTPLQAWVKQDGMHMDKDERYKAIRTWYARDRAATLIREVLTLLRHADASTSATRASA